MTHKFNPFSRHAGDLPTLAPAGKSTKVDQVVRKNLTVPAGYRALVAYTNIGRGPNHGLIYLWKPGDAQAPLGVDTISFSMFPNEGGECSEMRPSKSTLVIRNNTTPLNRAPYGYAFVGPNVPSCTQYPSSVPNGSVCQQIFDQIYGRRETQSYDYNEARELINGMSDYIDYHEYRTPYNFNFIDLEKRFFSKDGVTGDADCGMTKCYFIVPTAAYDQTLDLEFYNCARARYEIGTPLSRYATLQPTATGKVKEHVEKAAEQISEGKQPPSAVGGPRPR